MARKLFLALLLSALLTPAAGHAAAQAIHLAYFGYVGNGDSDQGLNDTKTYTNFTHLSAGDVPDDTNLRDRIQAAAARGIKVTIDLGKVLWQPETDAYGNTVYKHLWNTPTADEWKNRWNLWYATNRDVLTSDKLIAFSIYDEPFHRGTDISGFEQAAQLMKDTFRDPSQNPSGFVPKIWMIEAACTVRNACDGGVAFQSYDGSRMVNLDWIGVDEYAIHPAANNYVNPYQDAVNAMKAKFPNARATIYAMDAFWQPGLHDVAFNTQDQTVMGSIAREWYDTAQRDLSAILVGGFIWGSHLQPTAQEPSVWTGSADLPCPVLTEHISIGRAITGKARPTNSLPIGYLDGIDSSGIASGWACDPDGAICENLHMGLTYSGSLVSVVGMADQPSEDAVNNLCGAGRNHRFRMGLPAEWRGRLITAGARDLNVGGSTLPSLCPQNPACTW